MVNKDDYNIIIIQIFVLGSTRRTDFETKWEITVQGHPRSLISVLIEITYATSY